MEFRRRVQLGVLAAVCVALIGTRTAGTLWSTTETVLESVPSLAKMGLDLETAQAVLTRVLASRVQAKKEEHQWAASDAHNLKEDDAEDLARRRTVPKTLRHRTSLDDDDQKDGYGKEEAPDSQDEAKETSHSEVEEDEQEQNFQSGLKITVEGSHNTAALGGYSATSSSPGAPAPQGCRCCGQGGCRCCGQSGGGKVEESSAHIQSKITFENPLTDADQLSVRFGYARQAGVSVDTVEIQEANAGPSEEGDGHEGGDGDEGESAHRRLLWITNANSKMAFRTTQAKKTSLAHLAEQAVDHRNKGHASAYCDNIIGSATYLAMPAKERYHTMRYCLKQSRESRLRLRLIRTRKKEQTYTYVVIVNVKDASALGDIEVKLADSTALAAAITAEVLISPLSLPGWQAAVCSTPRPNSKALSLFIARVFVAGSSAACRNRRSCHCRCWPWRT